MALLPLAASPVKSPFRFRSFFYASSSARCLFYLFFSKEGGVTEQDCCLIDSFFCASLVYMTTVFVIHNRLGVSVVSAIGSHLFNEGFAHNFSVFNLQVKELPMTVPLNCCLWSLILL